MKVLYFLIDRLIITSGAEKKKEELPALSGEFRLTSSQGSRQGQTQRLRQAAGAQAHSTTFEPSPELEGRLEHTAWQHIHAADLVCTRSLCSVCRYSSPACAQHRCMPNSNGPSWEAFLGPSVVSVEETSCRL